MELFHLIDDGIAIVRAPRGVYKQTKVYRRGSSVYIGHGVGFLRICAPFDNRYGTSHPDFKVEELEGAGIVMAKGKAPEWEG